MKLGEQFASIEPTKDEDTSFEPFVDLITSDYDYTEMEELLESCLQNYSPIISHKNGQVTALIDYQGEEYQIVPQRLESKVEALNEVQVIQTQLLADGYHLDAILEIAENSYLFTSTLNTVYLMQDKDLIVMALSSAEPNVTVIDFGVLQARESKEFTVQLPEDFLKVEASVYASGTNETNKYGGRNALLIVNGKIAW